MISYKPLWKTLIDNDMKKLGLLEVAGISRGTLASMGKDHGVKTMEIKYMQGSKIPYVLTGFMDMEVEP